MWFLYASFYCTVLLHGFKVLSNDAELHNKQAYLVYIKACFFVL